ncbi:hypothetical protein [uncultured Methanobrevibacter sp.]|uniref:hypothetical protein n=1 Tax=uncultured Methanobrevibacter sp. TaxID=253161 RepID=UPI0025FC8A53|nr:hypothetical protein [uncultured Methanobrevibacter sp.]
MGKYPMTYEEYEKRVIFLFLKVYPEDKQEMMVDRLNKLLEDDPKFIDGLYGESCFRYDRQDLYGETCKKVFEDQLLESIPVNTLHMVLGGNF